jgi:uncharacterized LabA/DUF88 family protein
VLISGDGDFRRLVDAVQRRGKRVTVISTIKIQPPLIADELRRQADFFVDLADLMPLIARETPRPMAVDDLDSDVNEDEEDDEQVET